MELDKAPFFIKIKNNLKIIAKKFGIIKLMLYICNIKKENKVLTIKN